MINTLRNLRAGSSLGKDPGVYRDIFLEDEGAAKVGVVETTRVIQSYSHPSYPNLVFYDLPGGIAFLVLFPLQ